MAISEEDRDHDEDQYWEAQQEAAAEEQYEEIGARWAKDNLPELLQEHLPVLLEEHSQEIVDQFTSERMRSYYIAHPNLASPAYESLLYAQALMPDFYLAAVVSAVTATELAVKNVLLNPVIFGLVHTEHLASFISELTIHHTGMDRFKTLLTEILSEFGGVDLKTFKRSASNKTLWNEIDDSQKARNAIIHRGEKVTVAQAELSISVASTLLTEIFPRILTTLGLHLHDPIIVCAQRHTTTQ